MIEKIRKTDKLLSQLKLEKPVEVLFEGIDLNVYDNKTPSEERLDEVMKQIKEPFCFLFVGHWLNGEFRQDRKNISGLIQTFCGALKTKVKNQALILKTNGGNSLMDRVRLKKMINQIKDSVEGKNLPNIYLLHSDLTDWEMNPLYNHPKVKLPRFIYER